VAVQWYDSMASTNATKEANANSIANETSIATKPIMKELQRFDGNMDAENNV